MFLSLIVFIAHHFTTTFFPLEIYTLFRAGFARRVFKRRMTYIKRWTKFACPYTVVINIFWACYLEAFVITQPWKGS